MGRVQPATIAGPAGPLEGAFREAAAPRAAAVLAHPHPLHGGTLHNPVVFHADRELNRSGLTTLRFNFRGVGASAGIFDEGQGELADTAAAIEWLRASFPAVPLLLVGYSFGAWCAIRHAVHDERVSGVVLIGVPLSIYGFDEIERYGRPLAAVQGSADELGGTAELRERLLRGRPAGRLHVVEGADHRFSGRAPEAGRQVATAALEILEAR